MSDLDAIMFGMTPDNAARLMASVPDKPEPKPVVAMPPQQPPPRANPVAAVLGRWSASGTTAGYLREDGSEDGAVVRRAVALAYGVDPFSHALHAAADAAEES